MDDLDEKSQLCTTADRLLLLTQGPKNNPQKVSLYLSKGIIEVKL